MIDIDHFKRINDTRGHLAGDRVIAGLARLLRERLRTTDLVARYGGEEFCVALLGASLSEGVSVLETLRARFEETPTAYGGEAIRATFSAGVTESRPDDDAKSALARADAALYRSKEAGRIA